MSDRWWEYFESNLAGKHWLEEAVSQFQFMQPLYGIIQKYLPEGGSILDVGCGLGFNDVYLSSLGYDVTGLDNDPRIIDAATHYAKALQCETRFKVGDAFNLTEEKEPYDLVYSLGVLEHFDRNVTIELLKQQMQCARYVLIEIPSRYTHYAGGITDERIYSINELKAIVAEAGLTIEESFGFGDVMATSQHIFIKRILPHAIYRFLQNRGFAYCLAVVASTGHDRQSHND